jgi:putative addiction module component (TIGR02574 family)
MSVAPYPEATMTEAVERLKAQAGKLSAEERAELAYFLLRSLDPEAEDVKAEWLVLAEHRMSDVRAGQVTGIPAEDVLNSLPEEPGVEEAWRAEIARRVAKIRSGQAVGRPIDEVLAELRERYP